MPQLGELHPKEMNDVPWDKLSAPQAAGLGVSMSIFNDAHEECGKIKAEVFGRAAALFSCALVAITLLVWSENLKTALVAIIVTLVVGLMLSLARYRRGLKHLESATVTLKEEIGQLTS